MPPDWRQIFPAPQSASAVQPEAWHELFETHTEPASWCAQPAAPKTAQMPSAHDPHGPHAPLLQVGSVVVTVVVETVVLVVVGSVVLGAVVVTAVVVVTVVVGEPSSGQVAGA